MADCMDQTCWIHAAGCTTGLLKREHRVTMRCFLVYISLNLSMCVCFVELKGTSVWFVDISRSMTFLSNLVSVVWCSDVLTTENFSRLVRQCADIEQWLGCATFTSEQTDLWKQAATICYKIASCVVVNTVVHTVVNCCKKSAVARLAVHDGFNNSSVHRASLCSRLHRGWR